MWTYWQWRLAICRNIYPVWSAVPASSFTRVSIAGWHNRPADGTDDMLLTPRGAALGQREHNNSCYASIERNKTHLCWPEPSAGRAISVAAD
jgi:hypothetical protein